jgi:serine/threonine protein kinase
MGPQTSIAHYRLASKLGEGGMGTVWRATDTRLHREVAVKILPDDFAADPDRLARFAREAQVLASLNHPNIAAIYGVEDRALILELVEGPTLAERIAQGPIPLDEALPLLQQLADALEYAHEKGVVHRDLKPANLKITPDGRLKVLDFGLAKAFTPDPAAVPDPRSSPTLTMRATMAGAIMGTAAYMAPEQARGHNVDKRADIWAFGVVVYEMLAGRLLFDAPTVSDTLALVLTKDPDLTVVPVAVRPLLARCLERDPRKRLRDIGDALPLLATSAPPAPPTRSPMTLIALAAVSILSAIAVSFVHFREQPPATPLPVRFEVSPPPGSILTPALSLSPDGRALAFVAQGQNRPRQLWVRALDSLEARPLAEASASGALVWSADGRFLVFSGSGQTRKADLLAGTVQTLCSACPNIMGGGWNRDGVLLYTTTFSGLMRMGAPGDAPVQPIPGGGVARGNVFFLRDGRRFLYTREGRGIFLGALDTPLRDTDSPLLPTTDARFAYAQSPAGSDYILFQRAGELLAQRLDPDRLTAVGQPAALASDVATFTASNTGVLAYRAGSAAAVGTRLVWYDRGGKLGATIASAVNYNGVTAITPDGKSAYVDRAEPDGSYRVWVADLARGVFSRLSASDRPEAAPIPLPDGRVAVTYQSPGGGSDIYALGAGQPELLVKSPTVKHSNDVSPDGRWLIYDDHNGVNRQDLMVLAVPAPGAVPSKPIPFLATPADETFGQFSPDGHWVAYSSDETGRREIYVREFFPNASPAAGARKWLVSTEGGDKPRWSRNGRELYFLSPTNKMMAAPVAISSVFEPGIPVSLFDVRVAGFAPYVVAPDGRFLVSTLSQPGNEPSAPITVVLNWPATLK